MVSIQMSVPSGGNQMRELVIKITPITKMHLSKKAKTFHFS